MSAEREEGALRNRIEAIRRWEAGRGTAMFRGIPERWLEDPRWRCALGHVTKIGIRFETDARRCLVDGCGADLHLTFPEDGPGPMAHPALDP
jgi:hypothetical protein